MALISDHTPGWYAWIVETIIYPNAMFFQKLIVLTEIGLGLAFITGTFTVIAAIVSIGMNINFMLTTGLPPHASTGLPDLWLLITSTSMLGGGGRAFGLDHYIMPFLRNRVRWFQRREKKAKK
jgi:NADH dehydrogenase